MPYIDPVTHFWGWILHGDFEKHGERRSISAIARSAGLSPQRVNRYLRKKTLPPVDVAFLLAHSVDMSLDEMLSPILSLYGLEDKEAEH